MTFINLLNNIKDQLTAFNNRTQVVITHDENFLIDFKNIDNLNKGCKYQIL